MRRMLARPILFLLLSAIVNVALAWACALYSPLRAIHNPIADPEWRIFLFYGGFGVEREELMGVPSEQTSLAIPVRTTIRSGWPLAALVGSVLHAGPTWPAEPVPVEGAMLRLPSGSWEGCLVPLTILWPGFLLNTLMYAAILATLFLVPGRLRRTLRRRRGRCTHCNYDRRGLPATDTLCPECGQPPRAPR